MNILKINTFERAFRIVALKYPTLLLLLFVGMANVAFAQDKHSQQNYHPGIPYSISDIENINLTNGNLMFNFGFGNVKGRGSAATGMSLKYNSKLFESHVQTALDVSGNTAAQRFLREDSEGGWQYDGEYQVRVINRNDELDSPIPLTMGEPCHQPNWAGVYVWKLVMYFPDGSQHEFRPAGHSDIAPTVAGQQQTSDGYFNVDTTGKTYSLSYAQGAPTIPCPGGPYSVSLVEGQDPNPKMVYYSTDGTFMRLEIPNGQSTHPSKWTVYMPDGSKVTNGELDAQSNPLPQRIYDKNGNFISGMVDELGRYISRVAFTPMEDHIQRLGVNGVPIIWKIRWKYITVIRQYRTSGTQEQQQCCYSYQDLVAQPRVVDEIEMPSQLGGLKYKFNYNAHDGQINYIPGSPNYSPGWGELISVTLPSGAKAEYDYAFLLDLRTNNLLPKLGMIKEKRLKYDVTYDGLTQQVTDTWLYSISQSGTSTITGPDGGVTTQQFYRTDIDSDLSGRVYKETGPSGTIVERIWANNKVVCPSGCGSMRRLNTYVKTEATTIPDNLGNPSLTAIKDFNYDKNGNVTKITEYDWLSYSSTHDGGGVFLGIPGGAVPVRTTENAYYNQTEDASNATANNADSYWNTTAPNVRVAISSSTIKNGSGTPVSRSEFNYFDVDTTANLIETKTWDSFKGGTYQELGSPPLNSTNSISSTAVYDQYGNVTLATDAKGNQTEITYDAINGFTGLYPTQTISAYQTTIARTSSAAYDFQTGLVTTAMDVDNNISVVTVYDALGRPTKVRTAANTPLESWTQTEYNDVVRRVIVRSDLEIKEDGKKVAVQHYDQLGRVHLSRSIENIATEDPYNETHGIKVQTRYQTGNPNSYQITSNPYRANYSSNETAPTMGWTRSKSWNTGRKQQVETFTGAALPAPWGTNTNSSGFVTTDIDADRTLVTDQAGKQRISRTNAIGQLKDVWEVTASDANTDAIIFGNPAVNLHGYKTSYSYDTLNNLTMVNQGVQTRSFTYSSLSRLLSATNPESGLIQYVYDNNGNLTYKTDARLVVTNYIYDALNRVTNRNYTAPTGLTNYQATPNVSYFYDNLPNAKGKLTKVSSPVSTTEYTAFDILGRVTAHKQTTDGNAHTTGYVYNLSGALIEETYPSGRVVKNVLDNDGDLAKVESKKNAADFFRPYASSFVYSAAGAVASMKLGNGKFENTQFNSRLQPTRIGLGASATTQNLLKLNYDYGSTANNGNVLSQTITVPTVGSNPGFTAVQTYTYDSLNRLQQANEKPSGWNEANCTSDPTKCWTQTFVYDRYGNRTFDTTLNRTTTIPANCPVAVCNPSVDVLNNKLVGYQFDTSGNTKFDAENRTFIYDAENKQVEVKNSSSQTISQYFYDGDGKRIKKYVLGTGETTIFVYDAAGKLVAEYSTIVASTNDAKIAYLTNDHLGSPRINTEAIGNVTARHDYHPFGEEIATGQRTSSLGYADDTIRKQFTGYERDNETDLDFAQARMYSNRLARFTVPDMPFIAQEKSNPQTYNLFSYCLNNPYSIVDPDGHRWYYRLDEKNRALELTWINPNDDGSYTAPEGNGWQAYIAPEGGGMMFLGGDRFNSFYIGEDENGAPVTRRTSGGVLPSDEDLIPLGSLARGTGRILKSIGQAALAKWLFKEGVEEVTRLTANQIGKIGEDALAKYLGNLGGKKFFSTTAGGRLVDYFVDPIAHEAKTGGKTLTKFIRQQILKDTALLAEKGGADEVFWHFFKSPVTGKIGPSGPLRKALEDAGINIVLH